MVKCKTKNYNNKVIISTNKVINTNNAKMNDEFIILIVSINPTPYINV